MLKAMAVAAGLALAASHSLAQEAAAPRTITLTGHGETRIAPDTATISIGVATMAETARQAVDGNNAAMQAVLKVLAEAAIEPRDIQTSNFMVNPRYNYENSGEPPQLAGYDASNTVSVTVRKLADIGAVLDKVVSAGSNQINGISFSVANPDPAEDEARKLAVADARRRAEVYAGAAGVKLGQVLSMSENLSYQPPRPFAKTMRAEADSSVPIASGEQVIAADVQIVWQIE